MLRETKGPEDGDFLVLAPPSSADPSRLRGKKAMAIPSMAAQIEQEGMAFCQFAGMYTASLN